MLPASILVWYKGHRLRRRGRTIHAIPVSTTQPHRAHPGCPCKPKQVEGSPTKYPWHGVWEHN